LQAFRAASAAEVQRGLRRSGRVVRKRFGTRGPLTGSLGEIPDIERGSGL
jgi:hypothetical protein